MYVLVPKRVGSRKVTRCRGIKERPTFCADNEEICPSIDLDPRKGHVFLLFSFYSRFEKKRRNELHERSSCNVRCIQHAPWQEILNNCRIEAIVELSHKIVFTPNDGPATNIPFENQASSLATVLPVHEACRVEATFQGGRIEEEKNVFSNVERRVNLGTTTALTLRADIRKSKVPRLRFCVKWSSPRFTCARQTINAEPLLRLAGRGGECNTGSVRRLATSAGRSVWKIACSASLAARHPANDQPMAHGSERNLDSSPGLGCARCRGASRACSDGPSPR